jgi:hypothetical protein
MVMTLHFANEIGIILNSDFTASRHIPSLELILVTVCCNCTKMVSYMSAKQLPDNGFVTELDRLLLAYVHEACCDQFVLLSENNSSDKESNRNDWYVVPRQPPVQLHNCGTSFLDNHLACEPIRNNNFGIFDHDIGP